MATGLINLLLFRTGLMGADGVVLMLILLSAMADVRAGSLPLSFLLLAVIFLGHEVMLILRDGSLAQLAQLLGGLIGAGTGLVLRR